MGSKAKNKNKKEKVSKKEEPNLAAVKSELTAKRDEFQAWLKTNKLGRAKDYSDDKKYGKKYTEFQTAINELTAKREELESASKPAKGSKRGGFTAKYEYPADVVTAEQKKAYRVKQRAAAKKAEKVVAKEEKAAKAEKSSKNDKKESVEEISKETTKKPSKKDKKGSGAKAD